MDPGYGQQRRMRPDDRYQPQQQTARVPGPHNAQMYRPPPQMQPPPRPYQHRAGPPSPYGRQHWRPQVRRPDPARTYRQESEYDLAPPPVIGHSSRHLSHISAMSSPQLALDSRPVSEIESEYVGGHPFDAGENDSMAGDIHRPEPSVVRHASIGKKARPTMTTVGSSDRRQNHRSRDSATLPDDQSTMEALTAAIRQGLGTGVEGSGASTRSNTPGPMRMPFQADPGSPTSIYTETTANRRDTAPMSTYQPYEPRDSKPSTIAEQDGDDHEKDFEKELERSNYAYDLPTPMSHMSSHPIVAPEQIGMSAKIPAEKRPPRLDMGAVREAEARGSMTSLSDLIRRATRLASNLDRGRTASRLGHLDMFGSNDKLNGRVRDSTYSDVLAAFPPPADGANTPGRDRPQTMWPNGEKGFGASKSSLSRFMETADGNPKPKRKCCGMSTPLFVLVLVVVFLLMAAAVLVPVFLILLPKLNKSSNPSECPPSHMCQNGGVSVYTNNVCACICVDGFTGSDCSTERDPECNSISVSDGGRTYKNATVGSSVLPLLQGSQEVFSIPINSTKILSVFSYNNLSCASENSLIDFDADISTRRTKRFVLPRGMMNTGLHVPHLNLPSSESTEHKRFVIVDGLEAAAEQVQHMPTRTVLPRQEATQSSNGIVFATSSDTASQSSPTAGATQADGAGTPTASASSTPSPSASVNATQDQLTFAAAIVLYVLQSNPEINVAVAANQAIKSHLTSLDTSTSIVEIINGEQKVEADFDTFKIKLSNGTIIGGL